MGWGFWNIDTYLGIASHYYATKASQKIGHDVHISDFRHISDGGFASG
jgi:hypothetical protein